MISSPFQFLSDHKDGVAALVALVGLVVPIARLLAVGLRRWRESQQVEYEIRKLEAAKLRCEVLKLVKDEQLEELVRVPESSVAQQGVGTGHEDGSLLADIRKLFVDGRIDRPSAAARRIALVVQVVAFLAGGISFASTIWIPFSLGLGKFLSVSGVSVWLLMAFSAYFYGGLFAFLDRWRKQ
jgi:hypothetical protein